MLCTSRISIGMNSGSTKEWRKVHSKNGISVVECDKRQSWKARIQLFSLASWFMEKISKNRTAGCGGGVEVAVEPPVSGGPMAWCYSRACACGFGWRDLYHISAIWRKIVVLQAGLILDVSDLKALCLLPLKSKSNRPYHLLRTMPQQ